jgi:choline dehydrogenase-like flavoprotein
MNSSTLPTIVEDLPTSRRQFDYIIVGGGTAGCVIADRLAENLPNATILMIEGGESELGKEEILNLNGVADLWGSDKYDYSYRSVPQPYGTNNPSI